jgi:hypothetical protein
LKENQDVIFERSHLVRQRDFHEMKYRAGLMGSSYTR